MFIYEYIPHYSVSIILSMDIDKTMSYQFRLSRLCI